MSVKRVFFNGDRNGHCTEIVRKKIGSTRRGGRERHFLDLYHAHSVRIMRSPPRYNIVYRYIRTHTAVGALSRLSSCMTEHKAYTSKVSALVYR